MCWGLLSKATAALLPGYNGYAPKYTKCIDTLSCCFTYQSEEDIYIINLLLASPRNPTVDRRGATKSRERQPEDQETVSLDSFLLS